MYLWAGLSTGQTLTAVTELPTSRIEEQGRTGCSMGLWLESHSPQTTTFLSRLPVKKYLLSGLQSQDQMILLCTEVILLVNAKRLKNGSNSVEVASCLFHKDQVRSLDTASKNLSSGEKVICVTVRVWKARLCICFQDAVLQRMIAACSF